MNLSLTFIRRNELWRKTKANRAANMPRTNDHPAERVITREAAGQRRRRRNTLRMQPDASQENKMCRRKLGEPARSGVAIAKQEARRFQELNAAGAVCAERARRIKTAAMCVA